MAVLNKKQSREYDRDNQLFSVLNSNQSVYSNFLPFQTQALLFIANVSQFQTFIPQKEKKSSGITIDKNNLKQSIATEAAAICTTVTAYAAGTGNSDLAHAVRYRASGIKKLKNSEVAGVITAIIDTVTPLLQLPGFIPYNITTAMLQSLQQKAGTYNGLVASAGATSKASSIANDNINRITRLIRANIRQLSLLIHNFESTNPAFVEAYHKAIAVNNSNIHHTGIRGVVKNNNGQPLTEATITGEGKNKVAKADKLGSYQLIRLQPGLRTFTFSAPGCESQTITLYVHRGKILELNISLQSTIIELNKTA